MDNLALISILAAVAVFIMLLTITVTLTSINGKLNRIIRDRTTEKH